MIIQGLKLYTQVFRTFERKMYRADEFLEARINTREYVKNFEIKQTYFYVKRNNKHNKGLRTKHSIII